MRRSRRSAARWRPRPTSRRSLHLSQAFVSQTETCRRLLDAVEGGRAVPRVVGAIARDAGPVGCAEWGFVLGRTRLGRSVEPVRQGGKRGRGHPSSLVLVPVIPLSPSSPRHGCVRVPAALRDPRWPYRTRHARSRWPTRRSILRSPPAQRQPCPARRRRQGRPLRAHTDPHCTRPSRCRAASRLSPPRARTHPPTSRCPPRTRRRLRCARP